MFELAPFFMTLFFLAAVLLGVQVAFALSFVQSPTAGWHFYLSLVALAVSVPMLLGACLASLFGYYKELQALLIADGILKTLWFMFALMSYSILAGALFALSALICFKILQYRHAESKQN